MASSYTTHYGLCQWEAGDDFLRAEFNQDNARIDAAVKAVADGAAAATAAAKSELSAAVQHLENRLEPLNYNVYYLALQHYYEGKTGLPKMALLFDGFLDGGQVESRDPGLALDTGTGSLWLSALGESGGTVGVPGSKTHEESTVTGAPTWTPGGSGRLTGLTLYFTGTLSVVLTEAGSQTALASGTFTGGGQGGIFCPLEADVAAGRSYQFRFSNPDGAAVTFYYGDNPSGATSWLVYTRHVTPAPITSAAMTAPVQSLGMAGHSRALAWVRYAGGGVSVALNGGGGWAEMAAEAVRAAAGPAGEPCQEAAFSLEGLSGDTLQVRLTLTGAAGSGCQVYDYGVAAL